MKPHHLQKKPSLLQEKNPHERNSHLSEKKSKQKTFFQKKKSKKHF